MRLYRMWKVDGSMVHLIVIRLLLEAEGIFVTLKEIG